MSRRTVFGEGTVRWGCPVVRRSISSGSETMLAGRLLSATHFVMWALPDAMSSKKDIHRTALTGTQASSVHDEST